MSFFFAGFGVEGLRCSECLGVWTLNPKPSRCLVSFDMADLAVLMPTTVLVLLEVSLLGSFCL